jgi:hypothetical protein
MIEDRYIRFSALRRAACSAALISLGLVFAAAPAAASTPDDVVVSPVPAKKTPNVLDGQVNAIVQIGNRIVVGGSFSEVKQPGGATFARSNIFAFNATTFSIDRSFAPALDREVDALAAGPHGTVYVGGRFNTVNGRALKGLVKLDLSNGQRISKFKAKPKGAVFGLVRRGPRLFVAGNFSKISGTALAALAAVDRNTGALDPDLHLVYTDPRSTAKTNGALSVHDLAITPDGTRLVTTGNFQHVDGLDRNQIAVLDLTTSPVTVANWQTDRFKTQCPSQKKPAWLTDVAMSPNGKWFSAVSTGAYLKGQLCDTTTRWELTRNGSGLEPTWVDYTGGDSLFSVAVTGAAVYVGGHQRWMNNPFASDAAGPGAVARSGIAALDPENGLPLSWNPGRQPRGVGVLALVPTATGLWVGSDTDYIDGQYRAKLAFMPAAGGKAIPTALPGTLPGQIYGLGFDGALQKRGFDGTAGPPSTVNPDGENWSHARGAFMLTGSLYTGWDDGSLSVRSFNGSAMGSVSALDLHGLGSSQFPLSSVTGMFFVPARHRLYYSVAGDARLFYRYFTPESNVVGAETFVASGAGDGLDWSVQGLTVASGRIYYSRSDGNLRSMKFAGGVPVPGTDIPVSSTGDWASRGLFLLAP